MSRNYIKYTILLSVVILLFVTGQVFAQSEGWKNVADNVNKDQDQALIDTAEMEQYVKMDKAALEKELANFKAQDTREGAALTSLENEYNALRASEAEYKKALENEKEEIQAIEDAVTSIAKDAVSISRDNPITAEFPERKEILEGIQDSRKFPGMAWIKTLIEFYFSEMEESGRIVRREGKFAGPDGKETSGEILRIGKFTTYYKLADGTVGFLQPEADGRTLKAIQGVTPGYMVSDIESYFDKKSDVAAIDISGGNAFIGFVSEQTFWEWLEEGGQIMYVLLAVGIAAGLIFLERMLLLATKSRASEKVMGHIKSLAEQGNWKEAKAFCSSQSRIPTCQMLDSALEHIGHSQDVLENALQEAILKQTPKLERGLAFLALLGVIAPLLGLLGTVSGMIQTFDILTEVGSGDPAQLAGGISVALLTTYFGLILAIPIMVVHHFLKSQVEGILIDMEEKGTAFIITLIKQGSK
jgi:biopolymer transport protein ExbB